MLKTIAAAMLMSAAVLSTVQAQDGGKVTVITSFSKDVTDPFKAGFEAANPGYTLDVQNKSTSSGVKFVDETKGNLRPPTQTRPTALGDIEVTFAGRYVVDWGDGVEETFEFEGEPWPDGRIQHTYTHVGHYNVVVSIEWVADWRIGTTTGRISDGLASVSRIDNFEVRQLQAVRDR